MQAPLSSSRSDRDMVARIVAAARKCFARDTVAKTWMETVAGEVGLARGTLYTFVSGRKELVELALIARCRELTPDFMLEPGTPVDDVPEALVEMTATMVECTRGDAEFVALTAAMSREHAFAVLAGPSPIREMVIEALDPLLRLAREQGSLRPGLPLEEMATWVQSALTTLAGRPDLDASSLRRVLRLYLLPALLLPQS
jgi:AcrR family transcriptional regulator